ncbi:MAG: hypothetical protein ACI906_004116, partial [Candidatus Latescibacterota bacterium]
MHEPFGKRLSKPSVTALEFDLGNIVKLRLK